MGKCKVCGAEIADTEEMCEDCKALDDVDLIKSDDELEELLNSVMHSHTSYPNNDNDSYVSSDDMTIDPIKEVEHKDDGDEISSQLDNIANELLDQYTKQDDSTGDQTDTNDRDILPASSTEMEEEATSLDSRSQEEEPKSLDSSTQEEEPMSLDSLSQEEEEPLSLDSLTEEEEEPMSLDSLTREEEEPLSLDSLTEEEEEPMSLDSLTEEEEEPMSLDSLTKEEEEPMSLDSLTEEEEEPMSLDSLTQEEEPMSLDSQQNGEEEPFSLDSLTAEQEAPASAEEEPFSIDSFQEEEPKPVDDSVQTAVHTGAEETQADDYGVPGFHDIFDGIEDTDDKDNADVADIFADVLGTVSNYGAEGEEGEVPLDASTGNKKKKKASKKSTKNIDPATGEKKGFFKSLFDNIDDEETEKEYQKEKELQEAKIAKKAAKKEQKAAAAVTKKAAKAEAKKTKDAAKATKKAEKEKLVEEEESDHSKINKKGAAVVLVAFALVGVLILFGTKTFSYSASIRQAEDFFARKKYTKAYDEISGVDVKKSDQELADKIKTVMYVNKEYDSYNNYYAIQYYAEALNSLLNGLIKYDVYLEQASELGVKSDLQYVKLQITQELKEKFALDEKEAKKIADIEDQAEYSDKVIAIAEKLVADKKK